MWCATSDIVLCSRGSFGTLSSIGGIICARLECLCVPWEPWNCLSCSWCHWRWSRKHSMLIHWGSVTPPMLDILAKFGADWSTERWCMVTGGWRLCGGSVMAVAVVYTSPCHQPVGLLLHCVSLLALSHSWVHIYACYCISSASPRPHFQVPCPKCPTSVKSNIQAALYHIVTHNDNVPLLFILDTL
jgi:hypothetical protein